MTLRKQALSLCLCLAAAPVFASAGDTAGLDEFLSRMDKAASGFTGMSSNISQTKYTAVISDKSTESGTFVLRKNKADVKALINFQKPDPKMVAFGGNKAQIYYPAMKTVQEYDLGKQSRMIEQFLMLGFGSTGRDLKANYNIKPVGVETVAQHKTYHMVLEPKTASVKEQFTKFELWMDDSGQYPVQQQVFQPSGDYYLITYSDIKVNPSLAEAAVTMQLPKGVKREKH